LREDPLGCPSGERSILYKASFRRSLSRVFIKKTLRIDRSEANESLRWLTWFVLPGVGSFRRVLHVAAHSIAEL